MFGTTQRHNAKRSLSVWSSLSVEALCWDTVFNRYAIGLHLVMNDPNLLLWNKAAREKEICKQLCLRILMNLMFPRSFMS